MEKRITQQCSPILYFLVPVSVCHVTSHPVYLCTYWCNEVVKTVIYSSYSSHFHHILSAEVGQFGQQNTPGKGIHWFGYLQALCV